MNRLLYKSLGLTAAALALTMTQSAFAIPTNISDAYVGGNNHGYGDVIGSTADFDISSMDVELIGNMLSVTINTGFAGKGDNHLFNSLTGNKGIGYGDLFLSSSWDPYGTAPYASDDNSNGTVWTYGFSLDNRWMNEALAGTGTLYSLSSGNNNADALLSQDFLTGGIYRTGQEIAVDKASSGVSAVAGNSSSWNISSGKVNFLIDLTGTSLASADNIALHWGMTCGNDTIEGEYAVPVPEPAMLALLAIGLIGIGITKRKNA
jgi:hypothetical protein